MTRCRHGSRYPCGECAEAEAPTLNDFLLARLAEDYEVAWEAAPSPWREGGWDGRFDGPREILDRHGDRTAACYYGGTYGHVLRFDPTRILADFAAKQRIVLRHHPTGGGGCECSAMWPCADLCDLATVYADHADYDESWRP